MSDRPILKYKPADFLVREAAVPHLAPGPDSDEHYLLLRKSGVTTMEAVRLLAELLHVGPQDISYGGLKDEDGITEQLITVPQGAVPDEVWNGGWHPIDEPERWLVVQHYGYGHDPMRIGQLEGNGFRIVVRNLSRRLAEWFAEHRKVTMLFLNYYDTQRFGVPEGPKRTHFVGKAILERRWETALRELIKLRSPESPSAERWDGSPQGFFDQLDPRTTSFYLAAHASQEWNRSLADLVRMICPAETRTTVVDGIGYHHVTSIDAAARVLTQSTTLPYRRFEYRDGVATEKKSARTTVIQTIMSVTTPEPDEEIDGRYACNLRFFLPSGCYATTAVRQFLSLSKEVR